jgi:hypothetical protein
MEAQHGGIRMPGLHAPPILSGIFRKPTGSQGRQMSPVNILEFPLRWHAHKNGGWQCCESISHQLSSFLVLSSVQCSTKQSSAVRLISKALVVMGGRFFQAPQKIGEQLPWWQVVLKASALIYLKSHVVSTPTSVLHLSSVKSVHWIMLFPLLKCHKRYALEQVFMYVVFERNSLASKVKRRF